MRVMKQLRLVHTKRPSKRRQADMQLALGLPWTIHQPITLAMNRRADNRGLWDFRVRSGCFSASLVFCSGMNSVLLLRHVVRIIRSGRT